MNNILRAEYKKIFFLRFSKIYLLFTIGISLLAGFVFTITTDVTQGKTIQELSVMEVFSANMLGVDFANILFIIFTASTITREFTSQTIHTSLAVVPNRKKFFIGKYITFLLLTIILSTLLVILIYLTSQSVLVLNGRTTVHLTDSHINQFVLGTLIMPVFYSMLTVAAAFFFKNSGGSIAFSLIIMVIPALINMFSESVRSFLLPFMPQSAIHSLSGAAETFEAMEVFPSILVLFLWLIITSIIALISFQRSDF